MKNTPHKTEHPLTPLAAILRAEIEKGTQLKSEVPTYGFANLVFRISIKNRVDVDDVINEVTEVLQKNPLETGVQMCIDIHYRGFDTRVTWFLQSTDPLIL